MRALLALTFVLSTALVCQASAGQTQMSPADHRETRGFNRLMHQVESLVQAEDFDSAVVVAERALAVVREAHVESDSLLAHASRTLGALYNQVRNLSEARRHYRQWLVIAEKNPHYDQAAFANNIFRLASICRILCLYGEAESYVTRALQIYKAVPQTDDYTMADRFSELARIYIFQLRYAEAESALREALSFCTRARGVRQSNLYAEITNGLGNLCYNQGRYDEAESLFWEGYRTRVAIGGYLSRDLAESLNNIGNIYETKGCYGIARCLYLLAIDVREKGLGPDHPYLVYAILNLGEIYALQGDYAKAESLCRRALKIVRTEYGLNHAHAAWSLRILGDIYKWQGEYATADSLYDLALTIDRAIFGSRNPNVSDGLRKLALLCGLTGNYSASLASYKELLECNHSFIQNAFSYASEEQKLRYTRMYPLIEPSLLSVALLDAGSPSKLLALEMTLKGKALVIDAASAEREIAFCVYDQDILKTEEQLNQVRGEISALSLASLTRALPKEYQDSVEILYHTSDSLEIALSRSCSEFREELASRRFTVQDVAEALPEGGILCEFLRYQPHDFKKPGKNQEQVERSRYLAFTLDHAGNVTLTDLGTAKEIDSLISLARERIEQDRPEVHSALAQQAERRLKKVTEKLYHIIFAPLEARLGTRTEILVSPDGQLNLLPLEILPCPDEQYVIEKYKISYLSSGRDLLRFQRRPQVAERALLMANPAFDLASPDSLRPKSRPATKSSASFLTHEPARGVSACLNLRFDPLRDSEKETEAIYRTLKDKTSLIVDIYCAADAQEEVLKNITTPPKVLHLATHGYFCEDIDLAGSRMLENPLLRCGLAFRGANRLMDEDRKIDSRAEDGILTAFEASGLNLVGTELLTLSACETGVGEVKNGEGVYGLRRAFQRAGARTIVMSLWKVPDKETCELMGNFYQNWSSGQSKEEALRRSALKILHAHRSEGKSTHPLFWGGFVLLGDPR